MRSIRKLFCGCGWKKSTAPNASAALNRGRNFGSSHCSPLTPVSSAAPFEPSTVTARSSSAVAAGDILHRQGGRAGKALRPLPG